MGGRHFATRVLVTVAAVLALSLAMIAYGEIPAAQSPRIDGVAHHWVTRQMAYAPYTEPSKTERAAKTAAVAALAAPPVSVVTQADDGYPQAQATIAVAKSLKDAKPTIVGHELIVWSADKAARVYVDSDGMAKVIGVGTVQQLLASPAEALTDQGDRDAFEIAKGAFDVARGLDPKVSPASSGLVSAHGVGFAHPNGSHIVVRVGVDGLTSYPDW